MSRVWTALAVANGAWAMHLVVSYYLAWAACLGDDSRLLKLRHLTTGVAVVVGLIALWLAYGASAPLDTRTPTTGGGGASAVERSFLARLSIALTLMVLFGVLMAGATNV